MLVDFSVVVVIALKFLKSLKRFFFFKKIIYNRSKRSKMVEINGERYFGDVSLIRVAGVVGLRKCALYCNNIGRHMFTITLI